MDDSILISIKKLLGIAEDDTNFDTDVIMHINTVFGILQQLGVGPASGFSITDESATWSDYMEPDDERMNQAKTYMYLRVRLLFDPPQNSFTIDAIKENMRELEWRITVARDEIKEERGY